MVVWSGLKSCESKGKHGTGIGVGKFLVVEETPPYEDEVAQLEFFVPARLKDRVRRALIKRPVEILLEDGFDIGIGVYGAKKSEMSTMTAAERSG